MLGLRRLPFPVYAVLRASGGQRGAATTHDADVCHCYEWGSNRDRSIGGPHHIERAVAAPTAADGQASKAFEIVSAVGFLCAASAKRAGRSRHTGNESRHGAPPSQASPAAGALCSYGTGIEARPRAQQPDGGHGTGRPWHDAVPRMWRALAVEPGPVFAPSAGHSLS
ncbi:hypothetical protein BDY21DRAFT_397419 [Lineolata rhizophorae]|uniref:Uncharacterized protein n=1 Tax=Lineolata rhizophorae TaxID=578093 RepID=A0A6A6PBE6_9PEZI|nr:hypothetical protein BDY21DRAFT_397419 [Lineolata rhizophorae]